MLKKLSLFRAAFATTGVVKEYESNFFPIKTA